MLIAEHDVDPLLTAALTYFGSRLRNRYAPRPPPVIVDDGFSDDQERFAAAVLAPRDVAAGKPSSADPWKLAMEAQESRREREYRLTKARITAAKKLAKARSKVYGSIIEQLIEIQQQRASDVMQREALGNEPTWAAKPGLRRMKE